MPKDAWTCVHSLDMCVMNPSACRHKRTNPRLDWPDTFQVASRPNGIRHVKFLVEEIK